MLGCERTRRVAGLWSLLGVRSVAANEVGRVISPLLPLRSCFKPHFLLAPLATLARRYATVLLRTQ